MAIWQVGADGKAPAGVAPGDQIVTGGGVYEVGPDGRGTKISDLSGLTASGAKTTGSAAVVAEAAARLRSIVSGAGSGAAPQVAAPQVETARAGVDGLDLLGTDVNGIVYTAPAAVSGYDPGDYAPASTGSTSWGNIAGYAVLALIGIAVLDRLIGGKRKGGAR